MNEHDPQEQEAPPVHTLNALLRNAHQSGLSNTVDIRVLFEIDPDDGSSPSELKSSLTIPPATVSMATSRLMVASFVKRVGNTRRSTYFLTEKGKQLRAWIEDGTPMGEKEPSIA
jgi:DNA-binding MarR family transcriptional regulator